jgi:hypothetical protein
MTRTERRATNRSRNRWTGLDSVQKLIVVIVPLGLLHHADHVGRADHSSWPFRPELGPFTFTLLIYPALALAYIARAGSWIRAASLVIVAIFTFGAHTLIEPPGQIYGTWANNLSTDAPLYTVDPEHLHNRFDRDLPVLGNLATTLSIVLTGLLLVVAYVAVHDALAARAEAATALRERRSPSAP